MISLYLHLQNVLLIKDCIEEVVHQQDIHIAGISTNLQIDFFLLNQLHIDVVVLECNGSSQQVEKLLDTYMKSNTKQNNIKILPLFKQLNNDIVHLLAKYHLKHFLIEPVNAKMILQNVYKVSEEKEMEDVTRYNLDALAIHILHDLGLPTHLLGFSYIKTCVMLVSEYSEIEHPRMQDIYQSCAKIYETTASRVEKCIRTAIRYAYMRQPEKICIDNARPTSSKIILYVGEKLKMYKAKW